MKDYIKAPLLSGLVLPGLGQVINQQIIKGLVLMALTTIIFLALLAKLFIDISAVIGEVMGTDLVLGPDTIARVTDALRERDLTVLYVLCGFGIVIWVYSIVDAFLIGRRNDGKNT